MRPRELASTKPSRLLRGDPRAWRGESRAALIPDESAHPLRGTYARGRRGREDAFAEEEIHDFIDESSAPDQDTLGAEDMPLASADTEWAEETESEAFEEDAEEESEEDSEEDSDEEMEAEQAALARPLRPEDFAESDPDEWREDEHAMQHLLGLDRGALD